MMVLIFLLLICLSVSHFFAKRIRILLIVFGMVVLLFFISPLPQYFASRLESEYPVIDLASIKRDQPVNIIILGGGHTVAPGLPATQQLEVTALGRLAEGIRIYRQLPGSKLVCSGGSGSGQVTQAETLADAALKLGVNANDTLQIRQPQNTAEEAKFYAQRLGPHTQLILVTSAIHMPRAMEAFQHEGLHPVAAPTNFYIKAQPASNSFDFKPSLIKVVMMDKVLHEWVGRWYYRWQRNS
jgi:uncharacterized SAM-binding protein YcdF (DUF218 family)